jgi:predicted ArsR family transcriptional regulator
MATPAVVTFKKTVLAPTHVASLNQLTTSQQTAAAHAATLGITVAEATKRLSYLVDEGLATAHRVPDNADGASTGGYTTS